MAFLAGMLDYVNRQLNDPHASIGPSHYLVKDTRTLNDERAEVIWKHSILPALADRFFDTPDALKAFDYAVVRSRTAPDESVAPPTPAADEAEDDDSAATDTD